MLLYNFLDVGSLLDFREINRILLGLDSELVQLVLVLGR